MKVLARSLLILLLLTGAASATKVKVEMLDKNTTVNSLIEEGWQLHTVSSSDYVITYTLILFGEIITCKVDSKNRIECFKP